MVGLRVLKEHQNRVGFQIISCQHEKNTTFPQRQQFQGYLRPASDADPVKEGSSHGIHSRNPYR